jgi:hypothetical protein
MQKPFIALAFLSLVALTLCNNSGVKFGVDTQIFKVLTQIDFNKFVQGKTLLNHTEISGTYLFKYEVTLDNLNVVEVKPPTSVDVVQSVNDQGLRVVHLDVKGIYVAIRTDFSAKYGLFKDSGEQILITAEVNSVNGNFYFTETGDVVISTFVVDLGTVTIDFESGFYKFLFSLTKYLIVNTVEKELKKLSDTISQAINDWVTSEFVYDLGLGIGFNFTNVDRPKLIPHTKVINEKDLLTLFSKVLEYYTTDDEQAKAKLINDSQLDTTILTCGLHGSVYPNLNPDMKPSINPAVDMPYVEEYFDNELQILLSDYTINTLLFMGQQTGILKQEFTTISNKLFPFDFNVEGVSTIIPEFRTKYPDNNYEILMKAAISVSGHNQPILVSSTNGAQLRINFGLDFDTTWSDDPFDDPNKDLKLNITASCNIHFVVSENVLNVVIDNFNVDQLIKQKDLINADEENLKTQIAWAFNDVVLPLLNGYVKNVKVTELLKGLLGVNFHKLRLVSKDNYTVLSIGVEGLH